MPLRDHHRRLRPAMARQRPEACMRRPGQMIRVDPAAQVAPARAAPVALAVLGNTARADPVDLLVDPAAQVGPAVLANTARADPVDLLVDPAAQVGPAVLANTVPTDLVVPAVPVVRADPAVLGTGMLSAATSTEPRGAKDPLLGATASHPGRTGEGRSRRQGVTGMRAQSTTGATRKHPCGIPDSTSGASTSSEFGSRCK
jgi:hypothetical protein